MVMSLWPRFLAHPVEYLGAVDILNLIRWVALAAAMRSFAVSKKGSPYSIAERITMVIRPVIRS